MSANNKQFTDKLPTLTDSQLPLIKYLTTSPIQILECVGLKTCYCFTPQYDINAVLEPFANLILMVVFAYNIAIKILELSL